MLMLVGVWLIVLILLAAFAPQWVKTTTAIALGITSLLLLLFMVVPTWQVWAVLALAIFTGWFLWRVRHNPRDGRPDDSS